LYGALLVKEFGTPPGTSAPLCLSAVSLFDPKAVSSSRPALRPCRRAQKLSKVGRRTNLSRTPPLPGHTLTASSTTARLVRSGWRSEGSSLSGADQSRHNLVSGGPEDPNHDAAMRIGSEAPKRRTHSFPRRNSHGTNRDPPPRIVIGDPSQADGLGRNCQMPPATSVYCAGRKTTPSGTTPSRTSRHKAIKSLRAKATIMSLRVPRAFSVRVRNHCAKALFF
jgi:hypothetical protein